MKTKLTKLLGVQKPVLNGPMAAIVDGNFAAAVSNAGGFGMVAGAYSKEPTLKRDLAAVSIGTSRPWGIGFITWSATNESIRLALNFKPTAVMLAFGDPRPFANMIHESGSTLICQVHDIVDAKNAIQANADIIIAQGSEAGGHRASSSRATLALLPHIVDYVAPIPVVAAGGIADGRGLAAALMLGAEGAMLGTRFCLADEAILSRNAQERLIKSNGENTVCTRIFDFVRGYQWPSQYNARALCNHFTEKWIDYESQLSENIETERVIYQKAIASDDYAIAHIWASQSAGIITRIQPIAKIIEQLCFEATCEIERLHVQFTTS